MKKIRLFLLTIVYCNLVSAQTIGIGTATPNSKAALDISSTSKGLLIPSMTGAQRTAIASPPNGLMVYDTDINQFYHYDGTAWRKIINSTYWNQSTSRNWVYNSTDSVGIGTSVPAQRLDVNGNIRSRDNLLADGNVIATGNAAAANLSTSGNMTAAGNIAAAGTSLLIGDVTTQGDVVVNNTAATLQLRNGSNVNTGFFQLSGNNVRMGTNSGNNSGNMIIRMNGTDRVFVDETGNVGIGDANPGHKLEVNGNINLTGEIVRTSLTGTASLTPYCYGYIFRTGTIEISTGNFTVQRLDEGIYRINCTGIAYTNSVVIATSRTRSRTVAATIVNTDNFEIITTDNDDVETDADFYFVVFKL